MTLTDHHIRFYCHQCGEHQFQVTWILNPGEYDHDACQQDGKPQGSDRYGLRCAKCGTFTLLPFTGPSKDTWQMPEKTWKALSEAQQ